MTGIRSNSDMDAYEYLRRYYGVKDIELEIDFESAIATIRMDMVGFHKLVKEIVPSEYESHMSRTNITPENQTDIVYELTFDDLMRLGELTNERKEE